MTRLNAVLFVAAVITTVYQFSFFVFAAYFKFDKLTDLAGGSNFVVLALVSLLVSKYNDHSCTDRQIVASVLVMLWGVRLSGFLFYRIMIFKRDRRFDGTRENPFIFLGFWILQMAWVFLVSLPLLVLNGISKSCDANFGYVDFIGASIAICGLVFESWADYVKLSFKLEARDEERWCDVGPWKYSRHPNYFGELAFWWGIFIICASCFHNGYWITVVGPLFLTTLLLFFSGIPPLEKQSNTKWHGVQEYLEYRDETSPLIPLPRYFYGGLPKLVKRLFLFEWYIYEVGLNVDEMTELSRIPGGRQA